MPVALRGPNGETIASDESSVQFWANQGFHPITEDQIGAEIQARAARPVDRGFIGDVNAAVTSALSGATIGGSDILLGGLLNRGQRERLAGDIENAPIASTVGRFAGELLPAFASGGESLLAKAPAARLGQLATEAGELIGGSGAVSRVVRMAASGAVEGAVSNAGQYLGAMALQDKDLSAEGFLGSMTDGALYGGGAAGVLGIAGEGLTAARRLIPATDLTPTAVRSARAAAKQEVSAAVEESRELEKAARAKTVEYRQRAVQANPALQAELDTIALTKAREIAEAETAMARSKAAKAESDAAGARARAEAAQARAEKSKEPRKGRSKKAAEEQAPNAPTEPIPTSAATPDDIDSELMKQFKGTKDALDGGTPLDELSARGKASAVEDAINRRVAQESPEMERLLKHLDGLAGAREAVGSWLDKYPNSKVKGIEYTEGMRKQSGWVDRVPEGEGTIGLARGRQGEFRGTEAERQSFERKVQRKDLHRRIEDPLASVEEKAAAQRTLDEMNVASDARKAARESTPADAPSERALDAEKTAREIVATADDAIAPSVDDHVQRALDGHGDLADDVDDATEAIGALEQHTADLADELGEHAPPLAQERARSYRQAQQTAEASHAEAAADAVADSDRAAKMISTGDAPPKAHGLLQRATEAGQMLEALQMLGVPVPNASQLPVVGPLLSLYLKAKLAHRALKGLGGKVPRTAETEIARRANDTKAKLLRAVDHALGIGGRALSSPTAARAAGAGASSVLSAKLFDDRDPGTKEPKPGKDLAEIYLARKDEMDRSQDPGAIREAIRRRVRTADGPLLDAIAASEERRLKFIYDKMPRVDSGVQILGKKQRVPARSDIEQWSKYVAAAQRPAETLGALLSGDLVSAEAAETVRTVAPRLLQTVQQRIIEKATDGDVEIPYKKRVHLSTMLGIPLDDSQSPESAAFLDGLYQAKPQSQPVAAPVPMSNLGAPERINPETRI